MHSVYDKMAAMLVQGTVSQKNNMNALVEWPYYSYDTALLFYSVTVAHLKINSAAPREVGL